MLSVGALGTVSAVVEAIATTVGAGMLLGGFVAGAFALLSRSGPAQGGVADASYVGGLGAAAVLGADLILLR